MRLFELIQHGSVLEIGFSEEGYVMSDISDFDEYDKAVIDRAVDTGQKVSVNEGLELLKQQVKHLVRNSSTPQEDQHKFAVRANRFKEQVRGFNGDCYFLDMQDAFGGALLVFVQSPNVIQFPTHMGP